MATQTLQIMQLTRATTSGDVESLNFTSGVNVLVGRPNTGKSAWLKMLDYLLGDPGKPEDTFGVELAAKYQSVSAVVRIADEEIIIERNWKRRGSKSKIFVNSDSMDDEQFSDYLLERLEIPNLHFPKGNPLKGAWPRLSWRTLYRHIYRQQRFWADFADKQTDSEQHACLLLFLGIAEYLYSDKYEDLVEKRRLGYSLEGAKAQFENMMDAVSKELLDEAELRAGVTSQSLATAVTRLNDSIQKLQTARQSSLDRLLEELPQHTTESSVSQFEQFSERWISLQAEREATLQNLAKVEDRLGEIRKLEGELSREIDRIERAEKAGSLLTGLKITHCPACDQPVQPDPANSEQCFLCHQSLKAQPTTVESGIERLKSEVRHLAAELGEARILIADFDANRQSLIRQLQRIEENIQLADAQLATVRRSVASIVPPDFALRDMEIGRLQERIRQLERFNNALDIRAQLSTQIDELQRQIAELESEVDHLMSFIDYASASDTMSDGMITYLNELNASGRLLWHDSSRIRWNIRNQGFDVRLGDNNWSTKLGGTLTLYFLIAYHYALLRLAGDRRYHYPGFLVLDLPAKLDDGTILRDEENFILLPFMNLIEQQNLTDVQIIVAGSSFEELEGANRIRLDRIWT